MEYNIDIKLMTNQWYGLIFAYRVNSFMEINVFLNNKLRSRNASIF